jgi:polysaccharide pyruvyl transferase WcaK-like protein
MPCIGLCSWLGKKNIGDDELHKETIRFFRKELFCDTLSYSDISEHGVINGKKYSPVHNDVVLIGPGGVVTKGYWVFKYLDNLIKSKKKTIFFNVNINNSADPLIPKLQKLNSLWVVRDLDSVKYLNNNGITSVVYAPDLCFERFRNSRKSTKDKILTVNLNHYVFRGLFGSDHFERLRAETALEAIKGFLNWMMSFDWQIKLYPAQTDNRVDDRLINAYMQGLMQGKCEMLLDNDIRHLYNSSFILGSRYHVSVWGLSNLVPTIQICSHSKNFNLFHDTGLSECAVDYYSLTQESLIQAAIKAENNEKYEEKIENYRVTFRNGWEAAREKIEQYITN